ncbi:hypothetical protein TNCV_3992571 [Trichonephila clavipes]|uniref:Uncharacterized protein n=1 Tax=Trichonephila clavipes TaxID=2585209 RepID=A0A8X6T886_TRICX|nr:hypothetical protein TNCV_3992571 [Trichonephila clavipes]
MTPELAPPLVTTTSPLREEVRALDRFNMHRFPTQDAESWMACDAEDRGFQILNDDEIVASMQEESDPVDDEIHKDEENTTKIARVNQILTRFLR